MNDIISALRKPELCGRIAKELDALDLSKYKDSMVPLLIKDMDALRSEMAGAM